MLRVIHFLRKPTVGSHSIERLFTDVRAALPRDIDCIVRVSGFLGHGLFRCLYNICEAGWRRGQVNHVTGEVHFLVLGLPSDRTILTVHDCGNLHRLKGWRLFVLRVLWFTWPLRRVRLVTTISEATRRELIDMAGISPDRVRLVYNCVSPDFRPVPKEFNQDCPRILLLGTAPNKNLERMAEALAGINSSVELIGRPSPDQTAVFAKHNVGLIVRGGVSNEQIVEAYQRCDLLLFASTYEGFGLPIIEAQAVGRPVVTSNCSSMAEVAADSACLVDPFDVSSIRAGVQRVIGDPVFRAELVRRGFENQSRFSAAEVAAQYAALYREVAGARINQ